MKSAQNPTTTTAPDERCPRTTRRVRIPGTDPHLPGVRRLMWQIETVEIRVDEATDVCHQILDSSAHDDALAKALASVVNIALELIDDARELIDDAHEMAEARAQQGGGR